MAQKASGALPLRTTTNPLVTFAEKLFQPAPKEGNMQRIAQTTRARQSGPFRLTYRYIPGAIGDGSSLDNGAIMTVEFRWQKSRAKRLAKLRADRRVQWVDEG